MKKNKRVIMSLILASAFIFNPMITVKANSLDILGPLEVNQKVDANQSLNEELAYVLNSGEYDTIKKVDSSGNVLSEGNRLEDYIDTSASQLSDSSTFNRSAINLPDGTYVIDRKDGWTLGDDKGFLKSIIIPRGTTGYMIVSKAKGISNTFSVVSSVGFNLHFVSATLKAGYGYSSAHTTTIELYQSIDAPKNKDLFVKAYTIYKRFDTITVKDKKIVDLASSYVPASYNLVSLEFELGEKVNQLSMFQQDTYNVLGEQEDVIKHLIERDVTFEKTIVTNGDFEYKFNLFDSTKTTAGLYFTVEESGRYEIGNTFSSYTSRFFYDDLSCGTGVDMTLYKISDSNDQVVDKVLGTTPTSITEDIKYTPTLEALMKENCLTVDLQKGEKYLLILNKDKTKFKYSGSNDTSRYIVDFEKK